MSEATEKVKKTPEQMQAERNDKIGILIKSLKKGDEMGWLTVKYLGLKLTQTEWNDLVAKKQVSKENAEKCINELGLIKKYAYTPKAEGEKKVSRISTIPEAKPFLDDLEEVMIKHAKLIEKLATEHKIAYQPFWRGIKDKEETPAPTQPAS